MSIWDAKVACSPAPESGAAVGDGAGAGAAGVRTPAPDSAPLLTVPEPCSGSGSGLGSGSAPLPAVPAKPDHLVGKRAIAPLLTRLSSPGGGSWVSAAVFFSSIAAVGAAAVAASDSESIEIESRASKFSESSIPLLSHACRAKGVQHSGLRSGQ